MHASIQSSLLISAPVTVVRIARCFRRPNMAAEPASDFSRAQLCFEVVHPT